MQIWQNAASQIPLQVEQNSEANAVWGPAELMTVPGAYLSPWARVDALWAHPLTTDLEGELVIYFGTKIGHLFQPFASTVGQWIGSLRISTCISFVFLGPSLYTAKLCILFRFDGGKFVCTGYQDCWDDRALWCLGGQSICWDNWTSLSGVWNNGISPNVSKGVKILIFCLCRMSLSEILITTNEMVKVQLSSNILGTGLDSI